MAMKVHRVRCRNKGSSAVMGDITRRSDHEPDPLGVIALGSYNTEMLSVFLLSVSGV